MTKKLVNKVNEYNKKNMPWWDIEEDETCEGVAAEEIIKQMDEYYGKDGWNAELRDSLEEESLKETDREWHVKMESADGETKWLETETTSERTYVFEAVYDTERKLCRSEELVGWVWGEFFTRDEVIRCAAGKRMKAIYR